MKLFVDKDKLKYACLKRKLRPRLNCDDDFMAN
jgi:hypothetical protein